MGHPDVGLALACLSLGSAVLAAGLGLCAFLVIRKAPPISSGERRQTPHDWQTVVIEMHPDFQDAVAHLRKSLGLADKAHVIQKAIQVLTIITDNGGRFYIDRPDGQLQSVILSEAATATPHRVH